MEHARKILGPMLALALASAFAWLPAGTTTGNGGHSAMTVPPSAGGIFGHAGGWNATGMGSSRSDKPGLVECGGTTSPCTIYVPLVSRRVLGGVTGEVVDATTAAPVPGATVCVVSTQQCAATTAQGGYTIPDVPAGSQAVRATAPGYAALEQTATVPTAGASTLNFVLSPNLAPGEMRIVLTWGQAPEDLDTHLWLPESQPYHVYFVTKGSCSAFPYACLVVDDMTSYGPETVTIAQRYGGTYVYAVFNWSDDAPLAQSGGRVQVYDSSGLMAQVLVPASGSGRWWYVFDLDGATGQLALRNTIQTAPPAPYEAGGEDRAK